MNIYNIYIILKVLKKELNSNFLKSLISFFIRSRSNIIKIVDFGNYFYNKNVKRLFYLNINCKKNIIKKIYRLFKIKKDFIFNFLIIKKNLNNFILEFDNFKKNINKNFKIIPSILISVNFKNYNVYSKIIKNLKRINLIPTNFINYIKKINFFYD
ncbi:hypothetical protein MEJ65_00355 [Candidatus Carsonella ruddii]|uniref:Uncharacterized protein n=1 Tax=Carsonella ruddii TaxID=114186 RepID=A0AAJ6JYH1_CARRU|nr:hypothetical protein [Candidatus Carsonella ruddii]WGS66732.1 hypothetical protein MEJ66_00360 [Candidatus Carsonella ruddii]WGS66926.1 hypothetical protein MEJ62_00350 [Candidatus Carsonella ruddii]WGS67118.1 hypothetical protein MEJ60_00350 [Candidatus Carsonella ruddii]WGS67310.1 hypothetical protein MEJ65_00355 [Candidatus Carsonella ruddii]WMC18327.1 MAG: hypothetical protein NU472_00355 [Candidatus Carsonella ruddii]